MEKVNNCNDNANANDKPLAHNHENIDGGTDVKNKKNVSDLYDEANSNDIILGEAEGVDVGNKTNDEQADSMMHGGFENSNALTTIQHESQVVSTYVA